MMRVWLGVVVIALVTGPALGQQKERERAENAGRVMQPTFYSLLPGHTRPKYPAIRIASPFDL